MTQADNSPARYKWLMIGMLWCVCFLNYADRQAIFSVFPLLKQQLQLSDLELGVLGSAFMWVYALAGPLAGWLCDRVARKWLILGGLIFWSLITAATALTHGFAQLVVCRALGGLGEALYFPAAMSMISDYHGAETRSRAMSLHQSSVYAGTIAGGSLSGLIGQSYGWRLSFLIFGGLGVLLGVILVRFLREPVRGMSETSVTTEVRHATGGRTGFLAGLKALVTSPSALVLTVVFMAANFVAVVFLTWMPTFLHQKFQMNLAMAGFSATAYLQVASVLGVLCGGLLADRLRRRRAGGRLLGQSVGLLCGVPFLFLTGWTTKVPLVLGAMVGFGYFKGIYDANIFASLYDTVPVRFRGTAAGILNSMGWLGGGAAPVLIAVGAKHFGFGPCISATAVVYLFCGLLLIAGAGSLNRRSTPEKHSS